MIVILDLGWGNLGALKSFFYRLRPNVAILKPPEALVACIEERCVLVWPGVGSAMQLSKLDGPTVAMLSDVFYSAEKNIAICLGFQILFEFLEESKEAGLNLMGGRVKKLKSPRVTYSHVPLKHEPKSEAPNGRFYFNHSYFITPVKLAEYYDVFLFIDNQEILVMRQSDTFLGCQFHPEKSGSHGVQLLREFIN